MTHTPEPATGSPAPSGVLRELQAAAAVRRAARIRVADAVAEPENADHDLSDRRRAFVTATVRWVHLIRSAGAACHPVADIARAAGIAPSSVYYRFRTAREAATTSPRSEGPMIDGQVRAETEMGSSSAWGSVSTHLGGESMDHPEQWPRTPASQDALDELMEQSGGTDDDPEVVLEQLRSARKTVAAHRRHTPRL